MCVCECVCFCNKLEIYKHVDLSSLLIEFPLHSAHMRIADVVVDEREEYGDEDKNNRNRHFSWK